MNEVTNEQTTEPAQPTQSAPEVQRHEQSPEEQGHASPASVAGNDNISFTGNGSGPVPDGGGIVSEQEPAPYWPLDWRESYAAGDEKILNRLKRFDSPKAAIDSFFAADKKISSGQLKQTLPPNATPEQVAEYRKSIGVPETPVGYIEALALNDGIVVGDNDMPFIGGFVDAAHKANMTPAQVSQAVNWYYDTMAEQQEQIVARDSATKVQYDDELRKEWGPLYRRNLAAINGLLASAPDNVREGILGGRLADGTPIGNHPETLRWLANIAMEMNPAATVVPGAGTNSMNQIESEISAIEARMGGDTETRKAYFKDEKAQARYRELITARERMSPGKSKGTRDMPFQERLRDGGW